MKLVRALFGAAVLLLVAITLTACTSATDLVKALATDNASACVAVNAGLYGDITACRTNTAGAALIKASPGSVEIQHRGAQ